MWIKVHFRLLGTFFCTYTYTYNTYNLHIYVYLLNLLFMVCFGLTNGYYGKTIFVLLQKFSFSFIKTLVLKYFYIYILDKVTE